ncbi:uncharacterized protein [Dermacentor albipictus]|uniref:uncharacterized protein n=1 Tax=Dermacentor albipictus TaxID=60249 RepID=UPI0038FD1AF1
MPTAAALSLNATLKFLDVGIDCGRPLRSSVWPDLVRGPLMKMKEKLALIRTNYLGISSTLRRLSDFFTLLSPVYPLLEEGERVELKKFTVDFLAKHSITGNPYETQIMLVIHACKSTT